jgi:hypothetical protein
MSNMAASYKQRKEDFVSNLSGGSVSEISYVTAVAPVSPCPFPPPFQPLHLHLRLHLPC